MRSHNPGRHFACRIFGRNEKGERDSALVRPARHPEQRRSRQDHAIRANDRAQPGPRHGSPGAAAACSQGRTSSSAGETSSDARVLTRVCDRVFSPPVSRSAYPRNSPHNSSAARGGGINITMSIKILHLIFFNLQKRSQQVLYYQLNCCVGRRKMPRAESQSALAPHSAPRLPWRSLPARGSKDSMTTSGLAVLTPIRPRGLCIDEKKNGRHDLPAVSPLVVRLRVVLSLDRRRCTSFLDSRR